MAADKHGSLGAWLLAAAVVVLLLAPGVARAQELEQRAVLTASDAG